MRRYRDLSVSMSQGPSGDVLPELAAMDTEALMRCKGCGGKLGPGALSMALGRLAASSPAVELSSLDDAAVLKPPPGMAVLQSVDYFPALVSDPFVFGQIAVNHCLGDIHAMGAKPWAALALAQVGSGSEEIKQEDLFQMLAGAARVFESEGIVLVGGHSVEGDELALGFTVNGLAAPEEVGRKSGLRAGDALILTKPLGTGVLFAAEMRGRAKLGWIDCAVQTMLRSCGPAAAVLARHGVTGMTDVTGFGLAGHLGEMLTASKTDAELNLDAIPALDGAIELIEAGIESSLAPGNRERMAALLHDPANEGDARVALLADPQTADGLLAGVRADQADACVDALKAAGDDASIIGTVATMHSSTAAIHLS
ncbi:MAG: selenide, water dikinase SelD [Alphaproteobacteria bacterium]|nr:selenide, water dikinase SelD [Alphaproteobacteria bacterium]